jgi:hypothetical protein
MSRNPTMLKLGEALGQGGWKDALQARVFRFLTTPIPMHNMFGYNPPPLSPMDLISESDHFIQKFEHSYRLELLELAVWKVECLRQMPLGADLYTSHSWFVSGWKRIKMEQLHSTAMSTIASCVAPFLA